MKFHIQWCICCLNLPADEQRAEETVTNTTAFAEGLNNHSEGAPKKSKNGRGTLLWSVWKLEMKPELRNCTSLKSTDHDTWWKPQVSWAVQQLVLWPAGFLLALEPTLSIYWHSKMTFSLSTNFSFPISHGLSTKSTEMYVAIVSMKTDRPAAVLQKTTFHPLHPVRSKGLSDLPYQFSLLL